MTTCRNGGGWATDGCRAGFVNDTFMECYCDHLTNFAVLISATDFVSNVL